MRISKKFVALALVGAAAAYGLTQLGDDGLRPLSTQHTIQPSKDMLTQVALLDKHFSLREVADSFEDRFYTFAKDLGRANLGREIQTRLTVVGNQIDAKGDGKVSGIADPVLQQRISTGSYEVIREGFATLRQGNEKAFDAALKKPENQKLSVMYKDLQNSETMWRRVTSNVSTTVNLANATVAIDAPVANPSLAQANVVLAQANVPPANGQIYIPADNGRPQFKGFTSESRRVKGAEDKNEREQRQIQVNYGANNYGFGRQPEDVETQMRDLPGVFMGQALTSMVIIGREMANLSGDAKLKADLLKRVNDLERDTAGVGKDEMKAQGTRSLLKVDTNNPEVQKILMRSYQLGIWMIGAGQKQLFEKALLSNNTRSPGQTKAGISGASNIDYINLSSHRVLKQKNLLPAQAPAAKGGIRP